MGYPSQVLGHGCPSPAPLVRTRTGGTPPLPPSIPFGQYISRTEYATGSTTFALTQEDLFVVEGICMYAEKIPNEGQ